MRTAVAATQMAPQQAVAVAAAVAVAEAEMELVMIFVPLMPKLRPLASSNRYRLSNVSLIYLFFFSIMIHD